MMSSTRLVAPTAAPLKPCSICNGEACVVIPSIASAQHLCLIHYYSSGAHRSHPPSTTTAATRIISANNKRKSSSLFVDGHRISQQLPKAQELFAEAFVELQKDIGEESARAFQTAATADDPLALLLDSTAPASSQSAISRSFQRQRSGKNRNENKSTKHQGRGDDTEGGFIRQAVLPEKIRKLRNPNQLDGYASKYSTNSTCTPRKRPLLKSNDTTKKPINPYQRKQNPRTNIWNQVLDSNKNDGSSKTEKKRTKRTFADMEKKMISDITSGNDASSKTCSCGSTNVEISGNVTSRNNDMMKGEVWGMKNRAEIVVERCHCLACGKTWNEE